jgi:D-alanyl-D-alanine carboxypeptidase (penicillin-binding protein 5/6)
MLAKYDGDSPMPSTRCSAVARASIIPLVLLIGFIIPVPAVRAATALSDRLMPLINAHKGDVAVAVKNLKTDEAFAYHDTEPMPTASMIKFPIMIEAYRQAEAGTLDLDQPVELKEADKVPGSGILTPHFSAGASFALRDAIRLMIAFSDNTATNLVIDQIGLPATAQTMAKMGFANTKLHSKVFRRDTSIFPERSKRFGLGSTTAADMVALLVRLEQGKLISCSASAQMLDQLKQCEDRDKLARHLPPGTTIAHKGGSVSAARCDAGIIYTATGPIAVCVMTRDNEDRSWGRDNAGNRLCADLGREIFEYFSPSTGAATTAAATTLKMGASGTIVETLQRTLNARLTPSPDLGIDGDFGPMTRVAVVRFQQQSKLRASGEVGPETWRALEPLITKAPPVPPPAVVNAEKLPLLPADRLAGPPHVTCKAWVVGDGKTGKLLWGSHAKQSLDIASTTKIMTAYIVTQMADEDPALLDQQVVFSTRADKTEGSTSGVRAGEKLPVRELLYGLLLPSGNDASVALGEHFGNHFPPAEQGDTPDEPLVRFIAEMNRTAKKLGMQETHYENTHGLTVEGHRSSCRDLLRLTFEALKSPLFASYVRTRQHGATVTGASGYHRNLLWKNTNRLLPIDGYCGVKTGTTSAAGACLVSAGQYNDDRLIVIVLGATSSDARYVDARNLFRWAWKERGCEGEGGSND